MKIECVGKVISRNVRKTERGDLYAIVIEEPGLFPSRFEFTSTLATMFGPKDGPCGIGKNVRAVGFANGREQEIARKDGSGTFKTYRVYFKLSALEPIGAEPQAAAATDAHLDDDLPF